ncbi:MULTISPECIES: hypothetical protein [unclassified Anabaena]|uniref:hypothetical protein n=1 Tax=unclassified Anabaena TaxID=2619674 RepID=UPI0008300127|nr:MULTISPECIES: hypothetical protein [unclassified Anabaena]
MRTTTGSVHGIPPKPNPPSPPTSVPLYVYRELATELKATQAQLDALNAKNRQLAQENQRLRHEITQVVQSFLHLQKLVDSRTTPSYYPPPDSHPEVNVPKNYQSTPTQPRPPANRYRQPVVPEPPSNKSRQTNFSVPGAKISVPMPETVLVEEQEVGYYPTAKSEVKEVNGWWLALGILLIMLTAFGAGYLIVRPLFQHESR